MRCSKDGVVMICHDPDLKRVTGVPCPVASTNYADMTTRYAKRVKIEFGHHEYEVRDTDIAEVCTLEEAFAALPRS